jgi:polar amino acid transport system substrate-binding protein
MKKRFSKILLMVVVFLFSLNIFAKDKTPVLYVGTEAEFAPFEYLEDGKVVGFDMDLINEVAKIIGYDIKVETMKFDGLLPALQAKKLDIVIAGVTVTDERKKFVDFSDTYYVSEQMIVVNKTVDAGIKSFKDFPGKDIGVVLGYTADIVVSEIEGVNIKRYNGTGEAIMALKAKKLDAIVIDSEPAKNYSSQNDDLAVIESDSAKEEYAIVLRKGQDDILKKVNDALKTLKENGKYDELIKKYFK